MTPSSVDVRRAERRTRERLRTQPHVLAARYDRRASKIIVSLSNGIELAVPVASAQGLSGASASELSDMQLTPAGLGLHWPRLDADLYLPALMQGIFGTRRWMARVLGSRGGRASSAAKKAAARQRQTGRPASQRGSRMNQTPPARMCTMSLFSAALTAPAARWCG